MNGTMNVAGDALNFTIVMVSGIQVLTGQVTAGPDTGDTVAGAFYVIATVPSNPPGCVNGYDFAGALSL
jgi:hypothetical protein